MIKNMKKPIVIANWKATKTVKETVEWIKTAKPSLEKVDYASVIICPPYTSLPIATSLFENTNVKLGAQDVSKFKKGAYTGEVTIEMLDGLVDYCIVGHSERRKYFGETDNDVIEKVRNLIDYSITPVLCVSNLEQLDSYLDRGRVIVEEAERIVFVYEPPSAISGGGAYRPDTPEDADKNSGRVGEKMGKEIATLYGGSVNPDNAASFFSKKHIDGGLVGQASTDPNVFVDIFHSIKPASK
jgi:triosephosphate isomerase